MPGTFHLMLLYHHSMLDRLLLGNAIGQRVALSGTLSCQQFIPSLACNKAAPIQMPDASIFRCRDFNTS